MKLVKIPKVFTIYLAKDIFWTDIQKCQESVYKYSKYAKIFYKDIEEAYRYIQFIKKNNNTNSNFISS